MPGAQIIELVVSWVVTTALIFVLVIIDERRLNDDRLERAWPPSSRDAAIVAFGLFAIPVHFAKTRGHFGSARGVFGRVIGLALGLVAAFVVALLSGLLVSAIAWVLGLPVSD